MHPFSSPTSAYLEKLAAETVSAESAKEESLHTQVDNWIATLPDGERDGPHPTNILHQRFDAEPRHLRNAMVRLGYTLKRLWYDGETIAYWVK